ncbi:MAG: CPBP family intramembrane metalloprotease [Chlorobi bacterium]|nr:CPBP family intramembrane metalloprotease [Chlorobiota bacterium]
MTPFSFIRIIIVGLIIVFAGVMPWSYLIDINLKFHPDIPWAVFAGTTYLLLFILYLYGKGWPRSTSEKRRQYIRINKIKRNVWLWAMLGGAFYIIFLTGLNISGWLLFKIPTENIAEFGSYSQYPSLIIFISLIFGAINTGVIEEMGFRGYMQVPLEKHFRPFISIIIVALFFSILHLPPLPVLPIFVLASTGWGFLAYYTNSILPGIVFHSLLDGLLWIFFWKNYSAVEKIFQSSILQGDFVTEFIVTLATTVSFGILTVLTFLKLSKIKKENEIST